MDPDLGIVRTKLFGTIGLTEIAEHLASVLAEEAPPAPRRELYDLREYDTIEVTGEGVRRLLSMVQGHRAFAGGRVAVVTSSKLGYGMARLTSLLAEVTSAPFVHEVFRDMASAEAWLLETDRDTAHKAPR